MCRVGKLSGPDQGVSLSRVRERPYCGKRGTLAQSMVSELKQTETVSLKWGGLVHVVRAQTG